MAKGKYTPELADQIVGLIKEGNFESVAYGACGLSHQTYYRWKKERSDFSEAIKKAKQERITSLIGHIKKDASWQSKAWLLERVHPKKYHLLTLTERYLIDRIESLERLLIEKETNKNPINHIPAEIGTN